MSVFVVHATYASTNLTDDIWPEFLVSRASVAAELTSHINED